MAEDMKEDEQAAAKPPEKSNKLIPAILVVNTLLMGGVMAVVLLRKPPGAAVAASNPAPTLTGGANGKAEGKEEGAGQAGRGGGAGEPAGAADPAGAPGPILKLDNFIIQLRGTDTDRYVRVAFDLELANESDRTPVQSRMPAIRDAIISYFSDRSLDELRGSEGMERIKMAVLKKLEETVGGNRVRSIFITDLVIQ